MFKLIIEDDEGKTTVVPLIRDEITIGRKEGNTIRLTERNVSRNHAKILRQNGTVFIEDLSSHNGIRINGSVVEGRATVSDGDRIQIGDYTLALKVDAEIPSEASLQDLRKTQQLIQSEPAPLPTAHTDPGVTAVKPASPPAQPVPAEQAPREPETAAAAQIPQTPPAPPTQTPQAPPAPQAPTLVEPQPATTTQVLVPQAVPDPMDNAPTVPLRTEPETPARLVVLSAAMGGRSFALDKPKLVIGRTQDNDVVLDHRSISRHHASVLREHDRYHVLDLRSANGVRVNGDEYGKVELRHGDVVDLGHVRLRFVGAGEPYSYTEDPKAGHVPLDRRTMPWILPVLAIFGIGVAVAYLFRGPVMQPPTHPEPPPKEGVAPTTTSSSVEDESEPRRQMEEIEESIKNEHWGEAGKACAALFALKPNDLQMRERLQNSCERAEREEKNKQSHDTYVAARGKDLDGAMRAFKEIANDSVYKTRDAPGQEMKQHFMALHLRRAAQEAEAGNCDLAIKEANEVLSVDEKNARANRLRERCTSPRRASSGDGPPKRAPEEKPPRPKVQKVAQAPEAPPLSPQSEATVAEDLFHQALDAYNNSAYEKALELCKRSLLVRIMPLTVNTWVLSACKLRNTQEALKGYRMTEAQYRPLLRAECLKSEVSLP